MTEGDDATDETTVIVEHLLWRVVESLRVDP